MSTLHIKESHVFNGNITCDICPGDVEMTVTKTIGTKESKKKWRQRWFKCPVCGFEKKVNGSGYHSEVLVPAIIRKQIKPHYF